VQLGGADTQGRDGADSGDYYSTSHLCKLTPPG
jgi:hypothetical protein